MDDKGGLMGFEVSNLHGRYRGFFWLVVKEYFFVLMPFLVSLYFSFKSGVYGGFFRQSEWAMASVGLISQVLLKFLSIYGSPFAKNKNMVSIFFIFIIFDLILAVLVLHDVMVLVDDVFNWVIVVQVLLFVFNSIIFFVFSMVGDFYKLLEASEKIQQDRLA